MATILTLQERRAQAYESLAIRAARPAQLTVLDESAAEQWIEARRYARAAEGVNHGAR